jgi:hypothetical protein
MLFGQGFLGHRDSVIAIRAKLFWPGFWPSLFGHRDSVIAIRARLFG